MLYRHENWITTGGLGLQLSVSLSLPEYGTLHQSLVDLECLYSLIRFAEGPITCIDEINSIERAIRAFVFHDNPQILIPALNINYIANPVYAFNYGLHLNNPSLIRYDFPGHHSLALQELISNCNSSFHILPIDELLQFSSFDVMQSFISEGEFWQGEEVRRQGKWHTDFRYICLDPDDYFERRMWLQQHPLGTLARSIGKYGRPTYVHSNKLINALETPANLETKRYFDILEANWDTHLGRYQKYRTKVRLPLCLTIVLNRAKSRDDIFTIIRGLREEFSDARRTLWLNFEDALLRCTTESECIRILNKLENSANSVIPTGLRKGEYYSPIFRWLGRLMQMITSGANIEDVVQFADNALGSGGSSLHSVDASERLAESIGDLQPYHHLISRHLSQSEIDLLEKSRAGE